MFFFFQAEDGIRDLYVTGVQTCALPIWLGWPYVFWTMGALGILLTPLWFKLVHSPKEHPRVSETELRHIEQGGGLVSMDLGGKANARLALKWPHMRQLLGSRMLIGVYLGQFCITTLTYFFIQWFPGYLEDRGMSILKRSEEHTSELQSRRDLVCRLLL